MILFLRKYYLKTEVIEKHQMVTNWRISFEILYRMSWMFVSRSLFESEEDFIATLDLEKNNTIGMNEWINE